MPAHDDRAPHASLFAPRLLAWSVHLLTASGAVLGVLALWEVGRGGFARAAIYMLAAMSIDAIDGTLARRVGVAERIPAIDGRRLDDIVDYLNFAIVPVVFLLAAGAFVHWSLAALPVLASSYGFAQVNAKTEDDFFLGWPSYWNIVALYVWLLEMSAAAATAWVTLFSVLVFVPLKYVYPSKLRRFRAPMVIGGTLWVWLLAFLVWFPETLARWHAVQLSLVYPAVYVALSAWLGGWWRPARTS
jgi:phosphatidylcholine synthase